jgi:hypothetical protein
MEKALKSVQGFIASITLFLLPRPESLMPPMGDPLMR